jgi:hypothetical protein
MRLMTGLTNCSEQTIKEYPTHDARSVLLNLTT